MKMLRGMGWLLLSVLVASAGVVAAELVQSRFGESADALGLPAVVLAQASPPGGAGQPLANDTSGPANTAVSGPGATWSRTVVASPLRVASAAMAGEPADGAPHAAGGTHQATATTHSVTAPEAGSGHNGTSGSDHAGTGGDHGGTTISAGGGTAAPSPATTLPPTTAAPPPPTVTAPTNTTVHHTEPTGGTHVTSPVSTGTMPTTGHDHAGGTGDMGGVVGSGTPTTHD